MTFPVPRNSRRANKNRQKANKILSERDFPLFYTETTTTATLFFIPESLLMTVVRWKFAIKPNRPCSQDDLGPAKRKRDTYNTHSYVISIGAGGNSVPFVRGPMKEKRENGAYLSSLLLLRTCVPIPKCDGSPMATTTTTGR